MPGEGGLSSRQLDRSLEAQGDAGGSVQPVRGGPCDHRPRALLLPHLQRAGLALRGRGERGGHDARHGALGTRSLSRSLPSVHSVRLWLFRSLGGSCCGSAPPSSSAASFGWAAWRRTPWCSYGPSHAHTAQGVPPPAPRSPRCAFPHRSDSLCSLPQRATNTGCKLLQGSCSCGRNTGVAQ